jgi:hypothetical protein
MLQSSPLELHSNHALMPISSPLLFQGEKNRASASSNKVSSHKNPKSDFYSTLHTVPFQYTERGETRGTWAVIHTAFTMATGAFASATGLLSVGSPLGALMAIPTAAVLGIEIIAIGDNIQQRKKLNLIKKGEKKYALSSGSSGRVLKAHLTKRGAKHSVLKCILAGDPTQQSKASSAPYKIALIENASIGRTFRKTIVYTRDADLARKLYRKQLKACQDYLKRNPRFLKRHPKYQTLLHR